MKNMIAELRTSLVITLILIVLCCGIYPLAVWAIAQGVFPHQANGSLVEAKGRIVGSSLLAQGFVGP
ncbi:MAG TPA: potassium-transporting ATPase subunit C, partial [Candidatus Limnocylindrales bacterium]|nr:potassium-transporting ATPase subunit C [Candidatus Limnocylindrales bacterium]